MTDGRESVHQNLMLWTDKICVTPADLLTTDPEVEEVAAPVDLSAIEISEDRGKKEEEGEVAEVASLAVIKALRYPQTTYYGDRFGSSLDKICERVKEAVNG